MSNPGTGGYGQPPQDGWNQGGGEQSGWTQGGWNQGGWDPGGHDGYGAPHQGHPPQQDAPQQQDFPPQQGYQVPQGAPQPQGFPPQQSFSPQQGLPAQGAPQHGTPQQHGMPPQQGPRRPWGVIAVAFGCVAVLILTVAVGIGIFALTRDSGADAVATPTDVPSDEPTGTDPATEDPSSTESEGPTPTEEDAPEWEVLSPLDRPSGDVEDILATLAAGPLTEGSMFSPSECTLPETPLDPTVEQLQASLDAASGCLNQVWASTSSDRGLPWTSPTIVVFTWPDIPSSSCEHDSFDEGNPRMCNLDNTLYWPLETVGTSSLVEDPADMNSALVWDLSFIYMSAVWWNSGSAVYITALREELGGDEEGLGDTERRNTLQRECIATMVTVSLPAEVQPTEAYRSYLTSVDSWSQDGNANNPAATARAHWLSAALDSGGDMASCNTWAAEDDLVAAS